MGKYHSKGSTKETHNQTKDGRRSTCIEYTSICPNKKIIWDLFCNTLTPPKSAIDVN